MTRLADQSIEARRQLVARCTELLALHEAGDLHAFELKLRGVMEAGEIWRASRHAHHQSWRQGAA